jgi:hypothetical protein
MANLYLNHRLVGALLKIECPHVVESCPENEIHRIYYGIYIYKDRSQYRKIPAASAVHPIDYPSAGGSLDTTGLS